MKKELKEIFLCEIRMEEKLQKLQQTADDAIDYLVNDYTKIEKRELLYQLGDTELIIESLKELIKKLEELLEVKL